MTDDYSDEAAELDQTPAPMPDGADDAGALDALAGPTYDGTCHGGPWNSRAVQVRFPKGFLLVHKPEQAVWIYDRRGDGDFYARSPMPQTLREDGELNRWRAAQESSYDIRVLEPTAAAVVS
jgi:hypothetical protein